MNVSNQATKRLLRPLLVLLLLLSEPAQAVIKCDRSVLNNYGLSGAEYSTHSSMETCGFVHDRCCSIADEIKITNLWLQRTQPLLDRITSSYMKLTEDIIEIFWSIATLDPKIVLLQQLINQETPLKEQVCEVTSDIAGRKDYDDFLSFYDKSYVLDRPWRGVLRSNFFENGKRHWNVFQNSTYLQDSKKTKKFVKNQKRRYFNKLKRVVKRKNANLEANKRHRMQGYAQAGLNVNGQTMSGQNRFNQFGQFGRPGLFRQQGGLSSGGFGFPQNLNGQGQFANNQRFMGFQQNGQQNPNSMRYGRVLSEVAKKEVKNLRNNRAARTQKTRSAKLFPHPPAVSQRQGQDKNVKRQLRKGSSKGRSVSNNKNSFSPHSHSHNNVIDDEQHRTTNSGHSGTNTQNNNQVHSPQSGHKDNSRNKKNQNIKRQNGKRSATQRTETRGDVEKPHQESTQNKSTDTTKSQSQSSDCEPKVLPQVRRKRLRMADPEFTFDQDEPLRPDIFEINQRPFVSKFKCRDSFTNFDKDYLIVNQQKTKYCMNLYEGFLLFDFEIFKGFLKTVKANMQKVHYLKKYFYCAICDAHAISYIDHYKKVMHYEPKFCSALIKEHLDYLKFMHVVFIEFADSMLQYVQCYESDATSFSFPFQNFLVKYKRRIPLFQKCFRAVETEGEDFMASCWFICNKFSLLRVSNIFDGDIALLQRIKVALVSFIRKFGLQLSEHRSKQMKRREKGKPSFDLGVLNNVDGTLVEPVTSAFLISNGKFILNDIDRPKILGNYTMNANRIPTPDMEVKVDELLGAVNLGSIKQIREMDPMRNSTLRKKFMQNLNHTYEGDINAYEVSPVNKLINQLYNVTLSVNVSNHMLPPRLLKHKVLNIIKNSGLGVKNIERRLNLDADIGFENPDSLEEDQGRDRLNLRRTNRASNAGEYKKKSINSGSIMIDDGVSVIERAINSKQPNIKKKRDRKAEVDEEMMVYKLEYPSEMYEKEKPRTDLYNYGTLIQGEGLNPLKFVNLINFHANVTGLIGKNFKPRERIDRDTMLEYMTNDNKRINRFNEEIDEEIHPAKEVEIRYKSVSKYQALMDAGEVKRRPGMSQEAFKRQQKIILDKRYELRQQEINESMMKDAKELQKMKAIEKLNRVHTTHDHIKHKAYNTTFGGIKEFFASMFGS